MTPEPLRVARKEFSSEEIVDRLDEGQRVIVTVEALGIEREVTLRKTEGEYVCDTGLKLLTYETRDGMKQCIERLRLASSE